MKRYFATATLGATALAAPAATQRPDREGGLEGGPVAAVNELIPKLAVEKVEDRYDAQMALQDIASNSSKPGNAAAREALGKVLAAKAADAATPQPARVWIVRQLEYMGGPESVEALANVMNGEDAELRECARRALEKNPAPAATASLRAALEKASDATWKIGFTNSLGERGDAQSVALIARGLADAKTAPAAALALGKIANAAAVEALWAGLNKFPEAAEALINAANRMKAQNAAAAKAIYQRVAQETKSKSVRAAAEFGLKG
jgi:hypothetical protein